MAEHMIIDTSGSLGTVAPETYGHFIEHLGQCIYDGIWVGEKSSIPNTEGFRQEAVDVFRAVRAPLIRWPGGYFADCYNWRDGIGPRDKRPVQFHECEPRRQEPNQMGTHEFLRFCELVGAQPNLCANTATLGAQDAMDWVEYCNSDAQTSMANLRRANGREEPWGVKYWAIGNESYCMHRSQDYVQRYLLWRRFMQRVDPGVQCVASLLEPTGHPEPMGATGDWLHEVILGVRDKMELASLHLYTSAGPAEAFNEGDYWSGLIHIEQRNRHRIAAFLGAVDSVVGTQRVKLALDEWGLWHPGASMQNNCQQPCTHRDAIFAARYFHMLHDFADRIGLATIAQSVNVLQALLRTDGPRSYRTPTFHVFEMFKGHQGGKVLPMLLSSPRRAISAEEAKVTLVPEFKVVSASATLSADAATILLSACNADLRTSQQYDVRLVGPAKYGAQARCRVLAADPHAQNSYDQPDRVGPRKATTLTAGKSGSWKVTLPPSSVVTLEIPVLRSSSNGK